MKLGSCLLIVLLFASSCGNDEDQVLEAKFNTNSTSILVGESITFRDLSSGNPENRMWTFEGGNPATSNEINPEVTYLSAGDFAVTLQVSLSGSTDIETKEGYIQVTESDGSSEGLVAFYNFDNNISDQSGNGNHGELTNGIFEPAKNMSDDLALVFSSTTETFVEVSHSSTISLDTEMTIAMWFYYEAQPNSSFYTLAEKTNPNDGGHSRYGMWIYNGGIIEICIEPDTCPGSLCQRCLDAETHLEENTWNHLAGTYDGTSMKVYINGELNSSNTVAQSGISQTQFELYFGTDPYDSNPNYLTGKLNDFYLYNRALDAEEIKQLSEQ